MNNNQQLNQEESSSLEGSSLLGPASGYGAIPSQRLLSTAPPSSLRSSSSSSPSAVADPSASSPDQYLPHQRQAQRNPIRSSYRIVSIPRHKRGLVVDRGEDSEDDDDFDEDDDERMMFAKERLLEQASQFQLTHSPERGYRATEFQLCGNFSRPHMRAMHASWICFFAAGAVQFAMAPLLPQLQESLSLSKQDIWWTNVWMMIGGIPMRFLLGPLCDTYGPRVVMVWIVALCAIPCAFSGLIVVNLGSLLLVRFIMGAMDAFVPCQCWITSHFVREVGGTIMAIAGGLGASGAGFTQLAVGSLFVMFLHWTNGDSDLAWRLALLFPAAFALIVASWAYAFSDDCPLGNFVDVKKAGLMMERSAVDSFRSGVYNFNSWLLFLQFAGCCGVDMTMCNGCALYFNQEYHQSIQSSGAIAFLYGFAAIYARGLGGYVSDWLGDRFQLQGRLWIHFVFMLVQGVFNIWFARTDGFNSSLIIMVGFSIFVQVGKRKKSILSSQLFSYHKCPNLRSSTFFLFSRCPWAHAMA
jgi:NNP family nitrate/nitrite transporter-like MFS transporter